MGKIIDRLKSGETETAEYLGWQSIKTYIFYSRREMLREVLKDTTSEDSGVSVSSKELIAQLNAGVEAGTIHPSIANFFPTGNYIGVKLKETFRPKYLKYRGVLFSFSPECDLQFSPSIGFNYIRFNLNNLQNVMCARDENFNEVRRVHTNISGSGNVCMGDISNEANIHIGAILHMLNTCNLESPHWSDDVIYSRAKGGHLSRLDDIFRRDDVETLATRYPGVSYSIPFTL